MAHAVGRARAAAAAIGRDPARLEVTCNVITAVAASRADALRQVKRQVALILANGNEHMFTFQPHQLDRACVREALDSGHGAIDRAIPDETADALTVAATPGDLRERLASFERAGVDLALLRLAGTPDDQLAIIRTLGSVREHP